MHWSILVVVLVCCIYEGRHSSRHWYQDIYAIPHVRYIVSTCYIELLSHYMNALNVLVCHIAYILMTEYGLSITFIVCP